MELNDKIVIYRTADGQTSIDVKLEHDTVWLSQAQMAELFQKDQSVVARHISNVFKEGELTQESNMQILHNTFSKYKPTKVYSLDVIISVGYRVKSSRGTQFRIWANRILKDYLVKGYAVNRALTEQRYAELKQLVGVLGRTVKAQETLTSDDALSLVEVVSDYTYALDTLDRYDYQQLSIGQTTNEDQVWRQPVVWQREGRLVQELDRPDLPDLWRAGPLPLGGGEGGYAALSGDKEPLLQRRQQAHCRHAVPVVHGRQRHPLQRGRQQAHSRQYAGGPYADDSREPDGGEGRDGEGSGQPD